MEILRRRNIVQRIGGGGGDPPPPSDAWLFDDFSQYVDRAHLLNVSAEDNPWSTMAQSQAFVPGEFIFLDTSPPAGGPNASKTMRYDHGAIADCVDNVPDSGGGARVNLPGSPTELWVDFWIYVEDWATSSCGFMAYKMFFFDTNGGGRSDLNWVNSGLQGSLGPGAATSFTGAPRAEDVAVDGLSYFINRWTRIRWHARMPSVPGTTADGIFRLIIDDEQVANFTAETMSAGHTAYTSVRLGANLNNMMLQPAAPRTHWGPISLYLEAPDW